ncbi:MAG: hypothetical protein CM15mP83_1800 [Flavobacteriaceae bacterium]|nr:MAG: hypothetical protein CM15mP83_1800 [Flavobacteriaceae bacterium]
MPTHDVVNTIKNITSVQKCEWLVMGWGGRENAVFWLKPCGVGHQKLNANLALFKDNGVRNISKIVLGVSRVAKGIIYSVADNICKYYGASLTLLNVISKDASEESRDKTSHNNKELLRSFSREEDSLVIRSTMWLGLYLRSLPAMIYLSLVLRKKCLV